MTSFVNLLGNDQWTDADIINRTEAMIASEFPKSRIDILTRKVQGQAMGYALTEQEQADLLAYQTACYQASEAADAARADASQLAEVMRYEQAIERLKLTPVTEPLTDVIDEAEVTNPAIALDEEERMLAETVITNAKEQTKTLYSLRNPIIVIETFNEIDTK